MKEKVLVIGGTNFVGRNLLEKLLKLNSYDISMFNRGKTNPDLFPNVKKIIGDRYSDDIDQIFEEKWDYIIDVSCYFPGSLSHISEKVNGNLKRYIFISTCSVYDNNKDQSILRNETAARLDCTDEQAISDDVNTYGNRKAKCEELLEASGLKYSIFRPALIYGRYDATDRFYYWLYQVKKQKKMLIPNNGTQLFSLTYIDDLIESVVATLNNQDPSQIYNMTSHPKSSIKKIIDTTSELLQVPISCEKVNSQFLENNEVSQWMDLPLWLDCDYFTYDNKKLINDLAIQITQFDYSVEQTIQYFDEKAWPEPQFGISEELKNKLISKNSINKN